MSTWSDTPKVSDLSPKGDAIQTLTGGAGSVEGGSTYSDQHTGNATTEKPAS